MRWNDSGLEDALTRAAADGRRVVVKVEAEWCDGCLDLDREVLRTREGEALLGGMIGVRVDLDAEESRGIIERFAILDLPTLIVLRPDGGEAARVTGYESPRSWLEAARAAVVAEDEAAELATMLEAHPEDRSRMLRLGELLLARAPDDGEALLERVAFGDDALAGQALFLLARFQHRVRRDARSARSLWRELALRFPDGPHAKGAFAWHGRAQVELGHPEVGSAALEARVTRASSPEAVLDWAHYVEEHGYAPARPRVRAAAVRALAGAVGAQRDALESLVLGW